MAIINDKGGRKMSIKIFNLKELIIKRSLLVLIFVLIVCNGALATTFTGTVARTGGGFPTSANYLMESYLVTGGDSDTDDVILTDGAAAGLYTESTGYWQLSAGNNFAPDNQGSAGGTFYIRFYDLSGPQSGAAQYPYTGAGPASQSLGTTTLSSSTWPTQRTVTAIPGNQKVLLQWTNVSGEDYRVFRQISAGKYKRIAVTQQSPYSDAGTDITNLTNGTTYGWTVVGNNAGAWGPHSKVIIATPDASAPNITAVAPPSGLVNTNVVITGTNFGASGTVYFLNSSNALVAATQVGAWPATSPGSVTVTIPGTAKAGSNHIYLINSSNKFSDYAFTVTVPGTPTITSCSPARYAGDQNVTMAVVGSQTNFVQGSTTASLSNNTGVHMVGSVAVTDATHATITFSIDAGTAAGSRNIILTTTGLPSGTETATGTSLFVISPTVISSVTPATGMQGSTVSNVVIAGTGTHFTGTPTVTISGTVGEVTASSVVVNSTTQITCNFVISGTAALTARSVTVTTTLPSGSEQATKASAFTVSQTPPTFTSITPAEGQQGATLTGVTIVGANTHFNSGTPTVNLGSDVTVSNIVATDATHLTCTLAIGASAAKGKRDVVVTTGSEDIHGSQVFEVILHKPDEISKAYPNPFDPNNKANPLTIEFSTATGEVVDTYIFDTNGRVIWQNKDTQITPTRTIVWDGMTSYGEIVDNGLYMIRVVRNGKSVAKSKILVIKSK